MPNFSEISIATCVRYVTLKTVCMHTVFSVSKYTTLSQVNKRGLALFGIKGG
jgi:hypothetical protein